MNRAREILIGVASWIGIIGGLMVPTAPFLVYLQQEIVDISVDPWAYIIGGGAAALVTAIGRYGQEIAAILKTGKTDGQRLAAKAPTEIAYEAPAALTVEAEVRSAYPEPPQQADGAPTPAAGADGDGS